jgi:hypothetical protein
MKHSVEWLKYRMQSLQNKDPVGNAKIIKKLQRQIRNQESQN